MLFAGRRIGPPLPLLWRVFLTNAAMLAAATLALALSPATVSFPLALTEGLVLGGGLAATLGLDLLALRRAFGSSLAPTAADPEVEAPLQTYAVIPQGDVVWAPPSTGIGRQGAGAAKDVGTRLLVGWTRPYRLAEAEAEAWAQAELTRVLAAAGTHRARLMRLGSASARYHRPWDWLLEVEVASDGDVRQFIESPACRELLADLRLLGMRPAAMVTGAERVLSGGRG
jgi:hypothetical protein